MSVKTSGTVFEIQAYHPPQLLTNPSFTLWENNLSPIGWKGAGISREDDLALIRSGKSALRMPANSHVYQYIAQGIQPKKLYLATLRVRMSDKNWGVPIVASIRFFNEVGVQVGYTSQIVVDAMAIDATDHELKVFAEAQQTTQIARVTLAVDASDVSDIGKCYLIDEVTLVQY